MARKSIINVFIEPWTWVLEAMTTTLPGAPDKLPLCSWCKANEITVIVEYRQEGFFDDRVTLVCACPECVKATVLEYILRDEDAIKGASRD